MIIGPIHVIRVIEEIPGKATETHDRGRRRWPVRVHLGEDLDHRVDSSITGGIHPQSTNFFDVRKASRFAYVGKASCLTSSG
jgi:hypothetical protein